ncbi:MAG: type I phosphomannose isomerase catalytic subunit [Fibrobacterota bacterium]|nr:type I phosphomannose isomerase catalytic subunit [Chitinispirillaceae bacterium]
MTILEPFKVNPVFLEKIWGGDAHSKKLGKHVDTGMNVGESWEVSGEEPYQSTIYSGPSKGLQLGDFCERYGRDFLGTCESTSFPLLYKFIDANDKLSVQVHPDDTQTVNNNWGIRGKTECWYVVDAQEGSTIITGVKKDLTRDAMRAAIADGSFKSMLQEETVHTGDLFFIPSGTIHAIMAGCLIYEVQESSDITFRVYDWDRLDDKGKPRDLHIAKAIMVSDCTAHGSARITPVIVEHNGYTRSIRVVCRYFALEEYNLTKGVSAVVSGKKSFSVITAVKGAVTLQCNNSTLEIDHGESACIPAMSNYTILAKDKSTLLVSSVPDIYNDYIVPLRAKGVSDSIIIALGGNIREKNDVLRVIKNTR